MYPTSMAFIPAMLLPQGPRPLHQLVPWPGTLLSRYSLPAYLLQTFVEILLSQLGPWPSMYNYKLSLPPYPALFLSMSLIRS
jgi:hypothetical protein